MIKLQITSDKVEQFKSWMFKKGFDLVPAKGEWEGLRFRKHDEHIIYYKRKGKTNLFCPEGMASTLFQQFLNELSTRRPDYAN
jgi:hypothetical protein